MAFDPEGRQKKPGQSGGGEWVSPATVESYLEGLDYPASRQDIIDTARSNDAPDEVMHMLHQFSDRMYNSPIDVSKELEMLE